MPFCRRPDCRRDPSSRGTLTEGGKGTARSRDRSAAENLDLFRRMKAGEFSQRCPVLRAKIDMGRRNINLARPRALPHHHAEHPAYRQDWCIYPTTTSPMASPTPSSTSPIPSARSNSRSPPALRLVLGALAGPSQTAPVEFAKLVLTHTVMSKRFSHHPRARRPCRRLGDPACRHSPACAGAAFRRRPCREFCKRAGVARANSTTDVAMLMACVRRISQ